MREINNHVAFDVNLVKRAKNREFRFAFGDNRIHADQRDVAAFVQQFRHHFPHFSKTTA